MVLGPGLSSDVTSAYFSVVATGSRSVPQFTFPSWSGMLLLRELLLLRLRVPAVTCCSLAPWGQVLTGSPRAQGLAKAGSKSASAEWGGMELKCIYSRKMKVGQFPWP